jgi:hypothetical protein
MSLISTFVRTVLESLSLITRDKANHNIQRATKNGTFQQGRKISQGYAYNP